MLKENAQITRLHIFGNGISDMIDLAETLVWNTTLTRLDLFHNKINNAGAMDLGRALEKNIALTDLDLGSNLIGDAGAITLAQAYGKNKHLRKLNLSNQHHPLRNEADPQMKKVNGCLTSISDASMEAWAEMLPVNFQCLELNLSDNQITEIGATLLLDALRQAPSLTSLQVANPGMVAIT
jgi:Ran GTPase-activating protein (RanGAP) involved in mRNA processing and transport